MRDSFGEDPHATEERSAIPSRACPPTLLSQTAAKFLLVEATLGRAREDRRNQRRFSCGIVYRQRIIYRGEP